MTPTIVHGHFSGHLRCKMSSVGDMDIPAGHSPARPELGRAQRLVAISGPFLAPNARGNAPTPLHAQFTQRMALECAHPVEAR